LIVLAAGVIGWFTVRDNQQHDATQADITVGVTTIDTLRTICYWLAIWLLPLVAMTLLAAPAILTSVGTFFSKLAVVTFGGAYAVLAYMAQDVVVQFGWLDAGEMVDALGLAETTPGPLILVTQFVGFLAGFKFGGLGLGLCAALVALWVTFAPCFLWILAGAPYLEWISNQPKLKGALAAITAAVAGVILNLSIWFALHVLFSNVNKHEFGVLTLWSPELSSIEWLALSLFALSSFLAFKLHWNIISTMLIAAGLGAVLSYI
jgi:chromate transporter